MSSPRVVVVVQARLGSSRLPGKVLLQAGGRSLLEHLVRRLELSKHRLEIVIATTTSPADDAIESEARRLKVGSFRGSEDDVLARYAGALKGSDAGVVVRVTADCPLLDPGELDRVLGEFLKRLGTEGEVDYATNQSGSVRRIPRGLDVEVMSLQALERAAREAVAPGDREHVTPYLYRQAGQFRTLISHYPRGDFSHLRLTVDTPEDLALVRAIFDELGADATFQQVTELLARKPELLLLNAGIVQKTSESETELRARRVAGKLLIGRADAGEKLGFGHVARAGALLEAWSECGGRAELLGTGLEGALRARFEKRFTVRDLAPNPEELREHCRTSAAAALVIDSYASSEQDEARLRRDLPLLVFDDEARRTPDADLILNQNLGAKSEAYATKNSRVLAGGAYTLLRAELRAAVSTRARASRSGEIRRVICAFGASDPCHLSAPVAKALLDVLPQHVSLGLVLGAKAPSAKDPALTELLRRDARLELLLDPPDMASVWDSADLGVVAAGSSAWELMALGVPLVLVAVAPNQRAVQDGAAQAGAARSVGLVDDATPARIAAEALHLLKNPAICQSLSQAGLKAIDGRGCFRVIDALLDVIERRNS